MRITDLRKGDTIRCCDVEQRVEHIALHPSGTRVIFDDGATVTEQHLENCDWKLVGIRVFESRPEDALDRAFDALFENVPTLLDA